MNYNDEFIQKRWEWVLEKVDKYFHTPVENTDPEYTIREFIISPKKEWAFDILRKLIFNYKNGLHTESFQLNFAKGRRMVGEFHPEGNRVEYVISTREYLNGNTRVIIQIKRI